MGECSSEKLTLKGVTILQNLFFPNHFINELKFIGNFASFVIVLFIFLFFIASCRKEAPPKKRMLIEQRNGLIYLQGSDKPFTGTIQDTLKDQIFHYQVVDGIKDGEFKVSYKNGHVGILGRIENGKNEGKWQYFYENGKIESEGNFKNDSAYGKWVWFYEDGKKKEEGFLVDGKRNGKWIQYDNYGKVILEKTFKDDEEVDSSN